MYGPLLKIASWAHGFLLVTLVTALSSIQSWVSHHPNTLICQPSECG